MIAHHFTLFSTIDSVKINFSFICDSIFSLRIERIVEDKFWFRYSPVNENL